MIGDLISAFFNFLLTIIMTIIQIICLPLNALFTGIFPDFAEWLSHINNAFAWMFDGIGWALDIIPPFTKGVLLLIFGIELSMLTILKSTHLTAKAWAILQKLKFW